MQIPGIDLAISMMKTGLLVENISNKDKSVVEEAIKSLEQMKELGDIETDEEMDEVSEIIKDLQKNMKKTKE